MSSDPTRVAIVVSEDGSVDLASLSVNRICGWATRRRIELQRKHSGSEPYDVTTFKVNISETRDDWVISILPVIDEHHGLRAGWANDVALHVYGVGATPRVRSALEQFGLYQIVEWPDGFTANRGRAV